MIRAFLLLALVPGCAAIHGQFQRESWDAQMRRGDISYHDRTDLLLTQNDAPEMRHIELKKKKRRL